MKIKNFTPYQNDWKFQITGSIEVKTRTNAANDTRPANTRVEINNVRIRVTLCFSTLVPITSDKSNTSSFCFNVFINY